MDTDQTSKIEIDLSDLTSTIDNTIWVDGHGDPCTITASTGTYAWPNTAPSWSFSDLQITSPPQGKIELRGDDADIEINGESVVGMLKEIRDRLNILQVSEEMEAEWDELRALREEYEAKLAECREKSRAWQALQQKG